MMDCNTKGRGTMQANTKIAWRLHEIADATGVTTAFLRKQKSLGRLKTRKIDGVVLVLSEDLQNWLQGFEDGEKKKAAAR